MYRFQMPRYVFPLNGQWQAMLDADLMKLEEKHKKRYDAYDRIIGEYQRNPLAHALMHGKERQDKYGNDGLACVNNWKDDLILVTSPQQCGKSTLGAVYVGLRAVPCDPEWPCFKEHGIEYHEWTGPKIVIAGSYSWDNVNVLWQTYRKILPRSELQEYSPFWGSFPYEKGKGRDLRFHTATKIIQLACGTQFVFLCYGQEISHWESRQGDIVHLDEQPPEDYFDAASQRQLTRGTYTPIIITMTGHYIKGRPDTGFGGWIQSKLDSGQATKGRRLAKYKMTIPSVPPLIMSPEMKERARIQWVVEPELLNDDRKKRQAEAFYWGGWEVGGGLMFSEVNPEIHMIEPFELRFYQPTYYRMIDHGQDPCAAILFAVMPWGDIIGIKEYYEYGKSIKDNSIGIVEMCKNERRLMSDRDMNGDEVYEEIMRGTDLRSSELDSRSFGQKSAESAKTIGTLYNINGCLATPADGRKDVELFGLLKAALAIDKQKVHIKVRMKQEYPERLLRFGAPKLYFFSDCRNTQSEFQTYLGRKEDKDHLISCCKFMTATDRPYMGDYGLLESRKEIERPKVCRITGY